MRARAALPCLLAALFACVPAAQAGTPTRGRSLPANLCLDPSRARSWVNLDDRRLLVDAGRYKYLLEIAPACTAITYSPTIAFRGDPVFGRVCGSVGDAVLTRDYPCRIQRMDVLTKEQYQQVLKDRDERRRAKKAARRSRVS